MNNVHPAPTEQDPLLENNDHSIGSETRRIRFREPLNHRKVQPAESLVEHAQGVLPSLHTAKIQQLLTPLVPTDPTTWQAALGSADTQDLKHALQTAMDKILVLEKRIACFEEEFPAALYSWQQSLEDSFSVETILRKAVAQVNITKQLYEDCCLKTARDCQKQRHALLQHRDNVVDAMLFSRRKSLCKDSKTSSSSLCKDSKTSSSSSLFNDALMSFYKRKRAYASCFSNADRPTGHPVFADKALLQMSSYEKKTLSKCL